MLEESRRDMIKKYMLLGVLAFAYTAAHNDTCVACSKHKYEFEGSYKNDFQKQEEFWRDEEEICEKKYWIDYFRVLENDCLDSENKTEKRNCSLNLENLKNIKDKILGRKHKQEK